MNAHREWILALLMGTSLASPALAQPLPEVSELRSDVSLLQPSQAEAPPAEAGEGRGGCGPGASSLPEASGIS